MNAEKITRQMLTDYLLGRFSEDEQDDLAAQYFVDNALFEQLEEIENDLIDQRVRGQLAAAEQQDFDRYLNRRPDGWHKVAVAQAMVALISEKNAIAELGAVATPSAIAPHPSSKQSEGWKALLGGLMRPIPALACAILLFGLLLWIGLLNRRISQENQQLRTQATQNEIQQAKLQQTVENLGQDLTAVRKLNQELLKEIQGEKQLRETRTSAQNPARIQWILGLPTLRDPFPKLEEMRLNPKAKTVEINVTAPDQKRYTGYHVLLQTLDGKRLWEEDLSHTQPTITGPYIILVRPASQFDATTYKLTLTLIQANDAKTIREYIFKVVKQ